MKLLVDNTGILTAIGEDAPDIHEYFAVTSRRRASHIEPCSRHLRALFHLRRSVSLHSGWLAEWTRLWPCTWRVNLSPSGGPTFGQYTNRQQAIAAEHAWLEKHMTTEVHHA